MSSDEEDVIPRRPGGANGGASAAQPRMDDDDDGDLFVSDDEAAAEDAGRAAPSRLRKGVANSASKHSSSKAHGKSRVDDRKAAKGRRSTP